MRIILGATVLILIANSAFAGQKKPPCPFETMMAIKSLAVAIPTIGGWNVRDNPVDALYACESYIQCHNESLLKELKKAGNYSDDDLERFCRPENVFFGKLPRSSMTEIIKDPHYKSEPFGDPGLKGQ